MASGIVEPSQSGSEQQPQQQAQPPARTRLVQRLLANSANLPNFIQELIRMQAHIVAGTEAAAFLVEPSPDDPNTLNLKPAAHIREDNSDPQVRAAALEAFGRIIQPCIQQGKDGAIQIEDTHDGSEWQYCLVTLLRNEGNVVAASAVVTRARDSERAKQRLELMALVAGYFELFTLRRLSDQSRSVAQSHQHVLQLATSVATADGFESAAMNLCNELASRSGAARVSLGWLKGEHIKLRAISHSEEFDKKQELSVQIVRTMEECVDNDEIVQFEPDGTASETVTREAQTLSRQQGGHSVLSLPLRRAGEVVGVITLEFAGDQKIGPQAATGLAVAADLLAPQLYDRFQNDRWLVTKVGLSIQELGRKTYGRQYMLAKTIAAIVILGLLFVTFYKPMYHVKSRFQFVTQDERDFAAPYEGRLAEVMALPGNPVHQGDVLLKFDTVELEIEQAQHQTEADKANQQVIQYRSDPTKLSEMLVAQQDRDIAQKKADAVAYKIEQSTIKAPFDGQILSGDLRDRKGSMFKQGEPLIKFARRDSLEGKLFVEERDIQDVHENQSGYLATSAKPADRFEFKVRRIVPEGNIKDSGNVFEVYVTPTSSSDEWRPGMEGEARVDVEHRRLIWIWLHKFIDFVRIKLWI
ncbi:MAG TPA: HlyD family efflux transporter periplasmic adaptor subunit [Tepidisphaeraceae bacterium]|nr:HlyD family efflux transporter periplasmic adaptor subunit [Tepidisphaeraceae bacterium]